MLSGEAICRAHHGLSLLVTAHVGDERHTLLFDAGPEGATLLRNAAILGVDFGHVEAVVLSHGHWDHGGGLLAAVESMAARPGPPVECFLHPGMFGQRGTQRPTASCSPRSGCRTRAADQGGREVEETRDAKILGGDLFYVSGEIPRVSGYERGARPRERAADGLTWEPDPLIMDERFLAVQVKGRGQLVFSACSHAGIVNVLTHARPSSPLSTPLYGVMGGFHLSGATEKIIPETIADLKRFAPTGRAPGHCTGWRAMSVMAREFGDELAPSAVGKRYLFWEVPCGDQDPTDERGPRIALGSTED